MEHTPKNLLIRAVKKTTPLKMTGKKNVDSVLEFLHIEPTLKKLLSEEG